MSSVQRSEYSKTRILHLIVLTSLPFFPFGSLHSSLDCWQFNQCSSLIHVSRPPSHHPHTLSLSPELPFPKHFASSSTKLRSQSYSLGCSMFSSSPHLNLLSLTSNPSVNQTPVLLGPVTYECLSSGPYDVRAPVYSGSPRPGSCWNLQWPNYLLHRVITASATWTGLKQDTSAVS